MTPEEADTRDKADEDRFVELRCRQRCIEEGLGDPDRMVEGVLFDFNGAPTGQPVDGEAMPAYPQWRGFEAAERRIYRSLKLYIEPAMYALTRDMQMAQAEAARQAAEVAGSG